MHKKGPPRLNYSELHLLSVMEKLSLSQSFYLKKSLKLSGALYMWVTVTHILW